MRMWRENRVMSTGLGWERTRPRSCTLLPRLLAKVWNIIRADTAGHSTPIWLGKSSPSARAQRISRGIFGVIQVLSFCRLFIGIQCPFKNQRQA